ncbi:calcitonin receptor isoform X1 [Parasteatoda tepidariorum]|nr:calcitonin receptor isoform X2 [Parasteatoda tepidariorum]
MRNQHFCRVSGGTLLNPDKFALFSCASCYRHMDELLFDNGTKLVLDGTGTGLRNVKTNEVYEATYTDPSSPIFKTFKTTKLKNLWIKCCKAAVECCDMMTSTPPSQDPYVCPRTWDGWKCWRDSPPGSVQMERCPSYIYFHSDEPQCSHYATKTCWENATWFRNYKGNEYSDFSTCGRGEDIKILLKTHVITFGISIVLLLPALGIFFYYRQLRVYRIFMHKNLFISLLLSSTCVVVFESYFLVDSLQSPDDNILESNEVGCKIFYTVTKYFRLTTYMWMFCEGFYLHKLIAAAFAEQKSTLIFHAIGWGSPIIPVIIWAIVRHLKADEMCWIVPTDQYEWILLTPKLIALVVNFGFLVHIVQIIITKLRSSKVDEPAQFRRAVKATMVLIPLFGLHFLFLSYHPIKGDCHILLIYSIALYSLDGLQGGIVSLLFCYLNNEVIYLIKRSYRQKKLERDIANNANSRRTRESRTSLSTNIVSVHQEGPLSKSLRKK